MPLPEDEASWDEMYVMFATDKRHVRRNKLSDFVNVKANGKIAMKLEEGDRLIGVQTCTEDDDVLLAAAGGKCHPLPGRRCARLHRPHLHGVRGIKLEEGDHVISMSILRHVDAETGRARGLSAHAQQRHAATRPPVESDGGGGRETAETVDDLSRALRRAGGQGGVHPHRHRQGLRQAQLGL